MYVYLTNPGGFNRIQTHNLCDTSAGLRSTSWAMKPHSWEQVNLLASCVLLWKDSMKVYWLRDNTNTIVMFVRFFVAGF